MSGAGIGYRKQPVKATVRIVTGSRATGTIYQNTSGRPKLVYVTIQFVREAADKDTFITVKTGASTPPTTPVQLIGLQTAFPAEPTEVISLICVFVVPNGHYYLLDPTVDVGCFASMVTWTEVEL